MNRAVNITKRVNTSAGLRFCPVVVSKNGRIDPTMVLVSGRPEKHPEGVYYIEWHQGTKRCRLSVGRDARNASVQRERKEWELEGQVHGIEPSNSKPNKRDLATAIANFLTEKKLTRKHSTHTIYEYAMTYFLEACQQPSKLKAVQKPAPVYVEDVVREDLVNYEVYLRDYKHLAPRSVYNDFRLVQSFLKAHKVEIDTVAPSYTAEEPVIYQQEELDKLFAAATEDERVMFSFFLMTGMRLQEVTHCSWSDVVDNEIKIRYQPKLGWSPKAYKGRSVPVNPKLEVMLAEWKKKRNPAFDLIFPSPVTGKVLYNRSVLKMLKRLAQRAGLNPDNCGLHKFRATFATKNLEAGFSLPKVQKWLGHSDLESTRRYLGESTDPETRNKMGDVF